MNLIAPPLHNDVTVAFICMQVGYMGVPYDGSDMAQHPQYVTVRNQRGQEMLKALGDVGQLERRPAISSGDRRPLVMQVCMWYVCPTLGHGILSSSTTTSTTTSSTTTTSTTINPSTRLYAAELDTQQHPPIPSPPPQTVLSDDQAKLGKFQDPAPRWLGNVLAWLLNLLGPKGLEFARYSSE